MKVDLYQQKMKTYELKKNIQELEKYNVYPQKIIDNLYNNIGISKGSKIIWLTSKKDLYNNVITYDNNKEIENNSLDYVFITEIDKEQLNKSKIIAKKEGKIIIIDNIINRLEPIILEVLKLNNKYYKDYIKFNENLDIKEIGMFLDRKITLIISENNFILTKGQFIDIIISNSTLLKSDNELYINYLKELKLIFEKYKVEDKVLIRNKTRACIGRV